MALVLSCLKMVTLCCLWLGNKWVCKNIWYPSTISHLWKWWIQYVYFPWTTYIKGCFRSDKKLSMINGVLYFEGNPVETVTAEEALVQFIDYMWRIKSPVLVGHNIKRFDLRLLHHHLSRYNLWDNFISSVVGFIDTLAVFKKEFPKQSSYKTE